MMESSVNPGMCRCCASEGAFKDIKSTYHWMGEEEIYADMLRECFDIILNASEQGQDGGICEVCITQLRNAINFKKQVLHTEDQFQKHLQNKTLFRPHIVKVEVHGDEDSDDNMGSGDDAFSGAEFEVPIKTEVDDPKPKKRAATKAPATTTRASAKKVKADNGETSTKRTRNNPTRQPKTNNGDKSKWKKGFPYKITEARLEMMEEMKKNRTNLTEILTCSNATPFNGVNYQGYLCSYCDSQYPDPVALKRHTRENHKGLNLVTPQNNKSKIGIDNYCVKLDITGLRCTLCDTEISTLENLIKHLESDHKRGIHTEIKKQLLPFKFSSDTLTCCLCPSKFQRFRCLQDHMKIHYRNFICDECDMGFVTKASLRGHVNSHITGVFKCNLCPKTFDTKKKAQYHEKVIHVYKGFSRKCAYCNERFNNTVRRDEHLVKIHGVKLKVYKCHACDRTFPSTSTLSVHTRRDHLMERRFKCTQCDKAFFKEADLKCHMVTHTKTREFQCTKCLKSYGRKETLRQHMEIHSDVRRFKCEHCGQKFVQKASWKGHMRSKHDELV